MAHAVFSVIKKELKELFGQGQLSFSLILLPILSILVLMAFRQSIDVESITFNDFYTVGSVGGSGVDTLFLSESIHVVSYTSLEEAHNDLASNKLDAIYTEGPPASMQFAKTTKGKFFQEFMSELIQNLNLVVFEREANRMENPLAVMSPILLDDDPEVRDQSVIESRPEVFAPSTPSQEKTRIISDPTAIMDTLERLSTNTQQNIVVKEMAIPLTYDEETEDFSLATEQERQTPLKLLFLPLTIILSIVFFSSLFSISLAKERFSHNLELLLKYCSTGGILIGKMAPYVALSIFSSAVIIAFTQGFLTNLKMIIALFSVILLFFTMASFLALITLSYNQLNTVMTLFIFFTTMFLVMPVLFHGIFSIAYYSPITSFIHLMEQQTINVESYLVSLFFPIAFSLSFGLSSLFLLKASATRYVGIQTIIDSVHSYILSFPIKTRFKGFWAIVLFSGLIAVCFGLVLQIFIVLMGTLMRIHFFILLILLVFSEELLKAFTYIVFSKTSPYSFSYKHMLSLAFLIGISFLFFEKLFNIVFVFPFIGSGMRLFSMLLETMSMALFPISLLIHGVATSIFAYLQHKEKSFQYSLFIATLFHLTYNLIIFSVAVRS